MSKNYFFDEEIPVQERIDSVLRAQTMMRLKMHELFHHDFDSFIDSLMIFGPSNEIYLYGPSESGKSTIVRQACEIIGLDISEYSYSKDDKMISVLNNVKEAQEKDKILILDNANEIDNEDIKKILSYVEIRKKKNSNFHIIFIGDSENVESIEGIKSISIGRDAKIERLKLLDKDKIYIKK